MGNIHDIIANSNSELLANTSSSDNSNQPKSNGKFTGYSKRGYPMYDVDGKRMIHLGFYVSEQKLEEYYQIAQQVSQTGMRAPSGEGKGEAMLKEPNVNLLIHYATDFFCNNYRIANKLKPKDLMDLSKMLIKQMPSFMRK